MLKSYIHVILIFSYIGFSSGHSSLLLIELWCGLGLSMSCMGWQNKKKCYSSHMSTCYLQAILHFEFPITNRIFKSSLTGLTVQNWNYWNVNYAAKSKCNNTTYEILDNTFINISQMHKLVQNENYTSRLQNKLAYKSGGSCCLIIQNCCKIRQAAVSYSKKKNNFRNKSYIIQQWDQIQHYMTA